jgi:hypothetical protein
MSRCYEAHLGRQEAKERSKRKPAWSLPAGMNKMTFKNVVYRLAYLLMQTR